ncbi:beta-lactamase [Microscilla marina ATCC 23134]|uniref:Beta-lactamase n=2 Tax=Microscilla marina TaxID=1027 RepID=A1ZCN2_MICM2|nr:beta-lactamase [Microscilla marina ATCC 23134]
MYAVTFLFCYTLFSTPIIFMKKYAYPTPQFLASLKKTCVVILSLLFTHLAQAQQNSKAEVIDSVMNLLYANNQFNGAVLVKDKGKVIYKKALGWSNLDKRDTLKLTTSMRVASVSKQFTAMAIMILKERGLLDFSDLVHHYIPALPYKSVTIENLLHHNSGLPDSFGELRGVTRMFGSTKLISNDDIIAYLSAVRPKVKFKPGKKASYCNTGYILLASIVEKVSKVPFDKFLYENIFKPLKMNHTYIYHPKRNHTNVYNTKTYDTLVVKRDTIQKNADTRIVKSILQTQEVIVSKKKQRAYGYYIDQKYGWQLLDYHPYDGIVGEKSVCTTVEDLAKWDEALHKRTLVSDLTQRKAFTMAAVTNKRKYGYGYGFKIYRKKPHVVFHHGLYRGFRSYLQHDTKDKSFIVILTNRGLGYQMYPIYQMIDNILYGRKFKMPKKDWVEKRTTKMFKKRYWINYDEPNIGVLKAKIDKE